MSPAAPRAARGDEPRPGRGEPLAAPPRHGVAAAGGGRRRCLGAPGRLRTGPGSFGRPDEGSGGRAASAELSGAGPGAALGTIQGGSPREGGSSPRAFAGVRVPPGLCGAGFAEGLAEAPAVPPGGGAHCLRRGELLELLAKREEVSGQPVAGGGRGRWVGTVKRCPGGRWGSLLT